METASKFIGALLGESIMGFAWGLGFSLAAAIVAYVAWLEWKYPL